MSFKCVLCYLIVVIAATAFAEKSGSCQFAYENLFTTKTSTCNSDDDCQGSQKCCSTFPLVSHHGQVRACADPAPSCGDNEVLSKSGQMCTCDDIRNKRECQVVSTSGSSMCFCRNGYIRKTLNGPCVPATECEQCRENEIPTECEDACQTCDRSSSCTTKCTASKCACASGYIRSFVGGPCIPQAKCQCSENEEFRVCTNPCAQTCQERNPACALTWQGCKPGCECKSGFIRDAATGRCVEPEHCPAVHRKCGQNEHFVKCPSACIQTCNKRECPPASPCAPNAGSCECKPGFIRRTEGGDCIRPDQCETNFCGANEVLKVCPNICPATCEFPNPPNCLYPDCDKRVGCECAPGYIRSGVDGPCIKNNTCNFICGENEVVYECMDPCPRTCKNPAPKVCSVDRCTRGCGCKPGFVRHEGRCVALQSCPKREE